MSTFVRCARSVLREETVGSHTTAGATYTVKYNAEHDTGWCSCKAFEFAVQRHPLRPQQHWCKHLAPLRAARCTWREAIDGRPGETYGQCPRCWREVVPDVEADEDLNVLRAYVGRE